MAKRENMRLKKENAALQQEKHDLHATNESLSKQAIAQNKEIKELKKQVKKLKETISSYVTEAIALELLKETGLLDENEPSALKDGIVDAMTISATDSLFEGLSSKKEHRKNDGNSKVIRGLFDSI